MQPGNAFDASVAKLEIARARRLGNMLVTESGDFREPRQVLFDLSRQDAGQLLAEFKRSRENYSTSPFDRDGSKLKLHRKGYTIWSGYPGAGKTTALRQLVCHLLFSGQKVFVASLEEHPTDVIVQIAGVAFGREIPTEHQLQWFIDYYSNSLKIWGVTGIARHQEIFGTIQKLAADNDLDHVVIDSLMCLDINSQDWEAHRKFANLLSAVAIESNIHIHLVAHPRKAISVDQAPDINDVAGGADYARLAHNVVFVRRGQGLSSFDDLSPLQIAVRKQRYGSGFVGDITGWLNRRIRQFKEDQFDQEPTQYLPPEAYLDEV
jgi:twinkle protein